MNNDKFDFDIDGVMCDSWAQYSQYYDVSSKQLLLDAGLKKGQSVLNIGCGQDELLPFIAQTIGDRGSIFATDISEHQVDIAKEKLKNFPNVTTHVSDIYDLDLEPSSFDFIYNRFLLMYLPDPVRAIEKMVPLLKPGGKFVFEIADSTCPQRFVPIRDDHNDHARFIESAKVAGLSLDFAPDAYKAIKNAGLEVETLQFYQPVHWTETPKAHAMLMLQSLSQRINAIPPPDEVIAIIQSNVTDSNVYIEFFRSNQYISVKPI